MKKVFFVAALILFLGTGCTNNQQTKIEEQQKQIDTLSQKVIELSSSIPTSSIKDSNKTPVEQIVPVITKSETAPSKKVVEDKQPADTQAMNYSKINLKAVVQLTCWEDASNDFSNAMWGTGVVVNDSGLVLTNGHVVNFNQNTTCAVGVMNDYKKVEKAGYFSKVAGVGVSGDFAFLRIEKKYDGTDFVSLTSDDKFIIKNGPCKDEDLLLGDKLIVVGFPAIGGGTLTVTEGIISGFDGNYIKTSAKIAHGNSGGGAFHYTGCWIGIPTSAKADDVESLGYIYRWNK